MTWWQVVLSLLLGSDLLIKIVDVVSARKAKAQERKEELEDRAMDKDDKTQSLEDRFDAFCDKQAKENYELRQRLSGVEAAVGSQTEVISSGEYIDIRKEALGYIREGKVDAEDRAILHERYTRYSTLSKKKDLDNIMAEVDRLPLKV